MIRSLAHIALWAQLVCALAFIGPASAAVVKTQPPCGTGDVACTTFTTVPPNVRNFGFSAPSAGTAIVEFHGTMHCTNTTSTKMGGVVFSGIGTGPNVVPSSNSPGGLKHRYVFPPDGEITFNLASSRTFAIAAAGSQNYFFNLAGTLSAGISCAIYNASFRVLFL